MILLKLSTAIPIQISCLNGYTPRSVFCFICKVQMKSPKPDLSIDGIIREGDVKFPLGSDFQQLGQVVQTAREKGKYRQVFSSV